MSSSPLTLWSVNPAVAGDGNGLFRHFVTPGPEREPGIRVAELAGQGDHLLDGLQLLG